MNIKEKWQDLLEHMDDDSANCDAEIKAYMREFLTDLATIDKEHEEEMANEVLGKAMEFDRTMWKANLLTWIEENKDAMQYPSGQYKDYVHVDDLINYIKRDK